MRNKTQREYSLVIYNLNGILAVGSPGARRDYDKMLDGVKSDNRELIFSEYGLSEYRYFMALMKLRDIQFRSISEVSEQVKGLVAKLEEGK